MPVFTFLSGLPHRNFLRIKFFDLSFLFPAAGRSFLRPSKAPRPFSLFPPPAAPFRVPFLLWGRYKQGRRLVQPGGSHVLHGEQRTCTGSPIPSMFRVCLGIPAECPFHPSLLDFFPPLFLTFAFNDEYLCGRPSPHFQIIRLP